MLTDRTIYFKGIGTFVSSKPEDLDVLIPLIREREIKEVRDIDDSQQIEGAVRLSYKISHKNFTYLGKNKEVLLMCGVTDLPCNGTMSENLGALDGKGGIPYLFSTDMATDYKFEVVRRIAPIFFKESKKGYDFLTTWVPDYMVELFKLASRGGYKIKEVAVHNKSKAILYRVEWSRFDEIVR